jgi:hypothetical protein
MYNFERNDKSVGMTMYNFERNDKSVGMTPRRELRVMSAVNTGRIESRVSAPNARFN